MHDKPTLDLELELKTYSPYKISEYLNNNSKELVDSKKSFSEYISAIIRKNGLLKQDVLLKADIPLSYGYKLFSGEKTTRQRDVLLRICYAAELSLEEVQHVLKLCRMSQLYAKISRDALIMACFNQRPGTIADVNDLLIKYTFEPLRSSGART